MSVPLNQSKLPRLMAWGEMIICMIVKAEKEVRTNGYCYQRPQRQDRLTDTRKVV